MLKVGGTGADTEVWLQIATISLWTDNANTKGLQCVWVQAYPCERTLYPHTYTSLSMVVSASTVATVKEVMKKVIDNDKVPCVEDTIWSS